MEKVRWLVAILLVGLLAAGLTRPALGDDKEKDAGKAKEESEEEANARAMKEIITAAEMADFGGKHNAPEALIAAGSLLRKVAFERGKDFLQPLDTPVVDDKGNKVDVSAVKEKSLEDQARELFNQANAMAVEQKLNLTRLIKAAREREYKKGRAAFGGPRRVTHRVLRGRWNYYNLSFVPNQTAAVALRSNYPVRLVVWQQGVGVLSNNVVTAGNYTWVPRGKAAVPVQVRVIATDGPSTYTLFVR